MKITIGIPTYNRKPLLEMMAASLYRSDLSVNPNIRIYDDNSADYGIDELNAIFPSACSIKRNKINLKADKNMWQMYADFLLSGDDYFFNADSDLLFNPQWLNIALKLIEYTDGVLSVFNTNSHPFYNIVSDDLGLKKTVGAAGTLFKKERLEELMAKYSSMEDVRGFDWQFSAYFMSHNVRIYCVRNSLVQHIGLVGQNARYHFDIGSNFNVQNNEDGQILNNILVEYVESAREKIDNLKEDITKKASREAINTIPLKDLYKAVIKRTTKKILGKQFVSVLKSVFRKK